jgi:hypothetical protein
MESAKVSAAPQADEPEPIKIRKLDKIETTRPCPPEHN